MNIDIELLQQILNEACASGEEQGCQLAIYYQGKLAADLWAGTVAPGGDAVQSNTLFPVYSVSKGLTATLAHILAQEGQLDFNAPVAEYWPEFGKNNKESIKVWMIFSHRAGLWEMPRLERFDEQADWAGMCSYMEEAVPQTPPGGICCYHGITFGWLAGEIIARAGKKTFKELFAEKILRKLGLEDEWFFGTTPEAEKRLALPVVNSYWDFCDWRYVFMSDPAIRQCCIPSANGVGSARALARFYAGVVGCGPDNIKLLESATLHRAVQSCRAADDPVPEGLAGWAHFGLGYALSGPRENPGAIFGHGGALGSEGFAIPELGLAVGFTKNKFNTTHPIHPLRDRISQALNIKIRHW